MHVCALTLRVERARATPRHVAAATSEALPRTRLVAPVEPRTRWCAVTHGGRQAVPASPGVRPRPPCLRGQGPLQHWVPSQSGPPSSGGRAAGPAVVGSRQLGAMHRSQAEGVAPTAPGSGDGLLTEKHKGPRSARRWVPASPVQRMCASLVLEPGARAGGGAHRRGGQQPQLGASLPSPCHCRLSDCVPACRACTGPWATPLAWKHSSREDRCVAGPCGEKPGRPARPKPSVPAARPLLALLTPRLCRVSPARWERAGRRWDTTCMTWSGQRRSSARWRCGACAVCQQLPGF